MGSLFQDLRYGLRQLRLAPAFTLTAVLTLALAVGANTAVFTLVHAVMLKSLPVSDPAQLVRVGDNDNCCVWGGLQDDWGLFSYTLYEYIRDHTNSFEQLAAMQSWGSVRFSVRPATSQTPAESFNGAWVSGNFFTTMGVGAFLGRTLAPPDDVAGAAPVAVISYRAWQQRLGGKPSILGSSIAVNGKPFTVVGVAPPGFDGDRIGTQPPEMWITLATEPLLRGDRALLNEQRAGWLYLIGRVPHGAKIAPIEAQINVELRQWLSTVPEMNAAEREKISKQTVRLGQGGGGIANLKEYYKQGLFLLSGAAALVLLIGCANLANLLLARAAGRRQQISIQLALGASRARLIRGMLTESTLLAVLGGAAGLLVAYGGAKAMLLIAFRGSTFIPISTAPSLPILGFALGISVLTGILFGVVPAWLVSRANPVEALRGAGRSTRDHSALPQKSLVVVQASLSLVLLAGAGLVTQSLRNLQQQNFLFETRNRYVAFIDPELAGYTTDRLPALYDEMERRMLAMPGVRNATYAMYIPQGRDNWSEGVVVAGHPVEPGKVPGASWERVGPDYFSTIGTPILRGRVITDQDTASSRKVAVVNEMFVNKILPKNVDPMGMRFGRNLAEHAGDYEIVGIVADSIYHDPARPVRPMFFVPFAQKVDWVKPGDRSTEERSMFAHEIVLEVSGTPNGLEQQVRNLLSSLNPNLALLGFRSYEEQVTTGFNQQRLISDLTGVFSLLALVLASVGLYGVTAYRVARRTSEIGIRMALGATPTNVLGLILRSAFAQVGVGLLIGVPLALGAGRLLSAKLFGIKAYDPRVLAAAAGVLALAAFAASVVPARTAAAIEPMEALRTE